MASQLIDMIAELGTVLSDAVSLPAPATGTVNFYTAVESAKISLIDTLREDDPQISFPLIIVGIGEGVAPSDNDLNMNSVGLVRRGLRIYYVDEWGQSSTEGTQGSIDNYGWLMKLAMDSGSSVFNTFTVEEEGTINSGLSDELNRLLFAATNVNVLGVSLTYQPGVWAQLYSS
jgi:hypothetical protein